MEQIKRRNSTTDHNAKKRRAVESQRSVKKISIARFEDLSNELIYEIFEYLDYCQTYDTFFNLNVRFRNLFLHSTLPIKAQFLTVSRSNFQRYYNQLLLPNQHRIQSLHLSNSFIIERLFSPTPIFLELTQLQTLIINPIDCTYLENLLNYLLTLPKLTTLVLICADPLLNRTNFYNQVFRLPALKYCKLSLKLSSRCELPLIAIDQFSPIEHFVITNVQCVSEYKALLTCLPCLTRLSIHSLCDVFTEDMQANSISLRHLTHVSVNTLYISFDQFEFLVHYCFHQVQVLHISSRSCPVLMYLDADRWQRIIVDSIPHLRVFNILLYGSLYGQQETLSTIRMTKKFNSSFWFERQWFFTYYLYEDREQIQFNFFSINPYRRKYYTLNEIADKTTDLNTQKILMNSVDQVEIRNRKTIDNCQISFPNATRLTVVENSFQQNTTAFSNNLTKIIPLIQLTKFVYYTLKYDFAKMIELFQYMPNIHTFEIDFTSRMNSDLASIRQNDTFQLVSQNNKIRQMTIINQNALQEIDFLIDLCPRLEQLSINIFDNNFQFILQRLFSNNQERLRYLRLLYITRAYSQEAKQLQAFVESEKLFYGCSIRYDQYNSILAFWL